MGSADLLKEEDDRDVIPGFDDIAKSIGEAKAKAQGQIVHAVDVFSEKAIDFLKQSDLKATEVVVFGKQAAENYIQNATLKEKLNETIQQKIEAMDATTKRTLSAVSTAWDQMTSLLDFVRSALVAGVNAAAKFDVSSSLNVEDVADQLNESFTQSLAQANGYSQVLDDIANDISDALDVSEEDAIAKMEHIHGKLAEGSKHCGCFSEQFSAGIEQFSTSVGDKTAMFLPEEMETSVRADLKAVQGNATILVQKVAQSCDELVRGMTQAVNMAAPQGSGASASHLTPLFFAAIALMCH